MKSGTIIYIGGFELPDKNAAAHRVLNNAKIFQKLGYNVVFVDVDRTLKYNVNISETYKDVQGFECWSNPYPLLKNEWLKYLISIDNFKNIVSRYKNVKYVICYNYQSIALNRIYKYCQRRNIRIIGDCTEWYSAKGNGMMFYIIKSLDTFYRMRILHKKLDGLIVISDYLQRYYEKCKNLINLPPLVDMSESKWRCKTTKFNNVPTFIYAGSPGSKDKINVLIQAISNLSVEFKLDIIGISKEQYMQNHRYLEEIIVKLENNIFFHGRLNHKESLEYIKNADYSVFFREDIRSNQAGFPTKFVESVSCNTLVICNNTSNIKKYIERYKYGICVDEINSDKITLKIIDAINNSDNKHIDRYVFDYRNYVLSMSKFLEGILLC